MVAVTKFTEAQFSLQAVAWEAEQNYSRKASALLIGNLAACAVIAYGTPVKTAAAGNVGNGTIGAVTVNTSAPHGRYTVTLTAATTFGVTHENGTTLSTGSTGVAYSDYIGFTVTAGGTAFEAGDILYIDVGVQEFDPAGAAPVTSAIGILAHAANATAAVAPVTIVYRNCILNGNELIWKTGVTAAQKRAAYQQLEVLGVSVQF